LIFSESNSLNKSSKISIGLSPLTLEKYSNSASFNAIIAFFCSPSEPKSLKTTPSFIKIKSS